MTGRGGLPTGTVTFLFSDIEGSTRLLQRLGDRYADILERHQQLLRDAFARHAGSVVGTEGDSFFVAFPSASEAVAAAIEVQEALAAEAWPDGAEVRVRMGLHTGLGMLGGDSYVGIDVHRAARIAAAGHGGQVVLSSATRALVEHDLPDGAALRDLGEHRLKDLLQPEHLSQVVHPRLPREFPALKTLSAQPNNLPVQTSEFFGRAAELRAIRDLLDESGVRLLTLTGPGGIGKTRLALQVAAEEIERFADGVFFVELAPVRDPDEVFDAVCHAMGLAAATDGAALDALGEQLEALHVLLVLDNLEQVIDAAAGVVKLLSRCPEVRVLVTSRAALAVRGEHVFDVPPLSLPPAGTSRISAREAEGYEAVRLFVERARQARPDFALTDGNAAAVADICARLDGLPLAIELAAARIKLFSPEDLRRRLDRRLDVLRGGPRDLPARQQTLRDAIEWSYELLDKEQRSVFALLSLFPSARLEAVEAVAARPQPLRDVDVLDQVASLLDQSLIRSIEDAGSRRLSMLQTIREYAAERLEEDPGFGGAARQAHAEYFSDIARQAQSRLGGPGRDAALDELAAEIGNLRSAWRHWLDARDLDRLDGLLEPMWALHDARGWYAGAIELARDLLSVLSTVPSTPERAEQKVVLSTSIARGLLALRGYTEEVDETYRQARALLAEAGELPRLFPALRSLASLHLYRGEFEEAVEIGRRLLELAEQQHDEGLELEAQIVLGSNVGCLGDVQGGLEHLERAIELFDRNPQRPARLRLGASPGVVARTTSAFHWWLVGFPDRALARADEAVALARRLDHPFTLAYGLFHAALLALWRDEFEFVRECADGVGDVAEKHDYAVWRALALVLRGVAMTGLGQPGEGLAWIEHGVSQYQRLDTPPVFWTLLLAVRARSFGLAGRPADGLGFIDEAIELFGDSVDFLYPEMPLLKGDLLLAASGPEAAEPWFQQAFDAAKTAGTRLSQLRAATRLTRVRQAAGLQPDGSELLRAVYGTFTEGWDMKDLRDARAVLDG